MAVNVSTGFAERILGPQSFDAIFRDGSIEIRSGAQPASADAAAIGTLLARITRNGGAWVAGQPDNGLRFARSGRYAAKDPTQTWTLVGLATGIAGWFRLVANAFDDDGESLSAPRVDGAIALLPDEQTPPPADAQLFLPELAITSATRRDIGQWWYAIPPIGA